MRVIDDLVNRLETRNMAVSHLRCFWCPACLRLVSYEFKGRNKDVMNHGENDCRTTLKEGSGRECIADLRRESAERDLELEKRSTK